MELVKLPFTGVSSVKVRADFCEDLDISIRDRVPRDNLAPQQDIFIAFPGASLPCNGAPGHLAPLGMVTWLGWSSSRDHVT